MADPSHNDPIINAESRQGVVWAICAVFTLTSFVAVLLRVYTRMYILRRPGADDLTIVIAEVLAIALAIGASMEAKYGLGTHFWTIPHDEFVLQETWLYAVVIIYNIVTNVVKLAFLLQYRRFITDLWTLRICNWSAAVVIPAVTIVIVTTMATACFPLAIVVPSAAGHCLPQTLVWYCTASTNLVTDLFIFILPLPTIIGLKKISTRERVVLILMFSLGFFICIISILRIYSFAARLSSTDSTWNGVSPACWSVVEVNCGILVACLATLRPLFRRAMPWLGSSPSQQQQQQAQEASAARSYELDGGTVLTVGRRRHGGGGGGGAAKIDLDDDEDLVTARRPSFGSAEALNDHFGAAAYAGSSREATISDMERGEAGSRDVPDGLKVYVKQTFEATEVRVDDKDDDEKR